MRGRKREKGFTLIEFILVLGLFAIILGGIFFMYRTGETTTQAEDYALQGRSVLAGIQNYYIDNQRQYPTATCNSATAWGTGTCAVLKGYIGDEAVNAGWTYTCTSGGNPTVASPTISGANLSVIANKIQSVFANKGWSCTTGATNISCTNSATCP